MNRIEKFYFWKEYYKDIDDMLFKVVKALHPTDFYTSVCRLYKVGDHVSEEDKHLMKLAQLLKQAQEFTGKRLQEIDEEGYDIICRRSWL